MVGHGPYDERGKKMKKSGMLLLVFCSMIALLVVPGIATADTIVLPSDPPPNPSGINDYRSMSQFGGGDLFDLINLTNGTQQLDPAVVYYTPSNSNSPGWVNGLATQHTYVINLPSPAGGQPDHRDRDGDRLRGPDLAGRQSSVIRLVFFVSGMTR